MPMMKGNVPKKRNWLPVKPTVDLSLRASTRGQMFITRVNFPALDFTSGPYAQRIDTSHVLLMKERPIVFIWLSKNSLERLTLRIILARGEF